MTPREAAQHAQLRHVLTCLLRDMEAPRSLKAVLARNNAYRALGRKSGDDT